MFRRLWFLAVTGVWPAYAVAQNNRDGHMDGNDAMNGYGYMYGHGHMMDFWGGHIVTWILILIGVGALVYLLVKAGQSRDSDTSSHDPPIEILKRRYANGEISKEQFEQMKKDL